MNLWNHDDEAALFSWVLGKSGTKVFDAWCVIRDNGVDHPDVFHMNSHKYLFMCIEEMINAGLNIDTYVLSVELGQMDAQKAYDLLKKKRGHGSASLPINLFDDGLNDNNSVLDYIGGITSLTEMATQYVPDNSAVKLAKNVRELYNKRITLRIMEESVQSLQKPGIQQVDVIESAFEKLNNIAEKKHNTIRVTDKIKEKIHAPRMKDNDYRSGHWPLPSLEHTVVLRKSKLVTLAGPPGSGKSSLGAQVATCTAKSYGKDSVLYCSIEMDSDEVTSLLISQESRVPVGKIDQGGLPDNLKFRIEQTTNALVDSQGIQVMDFEGPTHVDIANTAKRMAIGGNLKLVIVDHIGIVEGDHRQSEYERICKITRSLKMLAKSCACSVLALCQINRQSMNQGWDTTGAAKGQAEPVLSNLRGSGSIEADSNAVVMLWNRSDLESDTQHKTICIKKNRTGGCRNIESTFHAAHGQCFTEGWTEDEAYKIMETA